MFLDNRIAQHTHYFPSAAGKTGKPYEIIAPYTRVSSNSEDQLHSFAAQVKHYTEYVAEHPEYELVDIYADEGITGTRMDKRDDFNRLIRDCKKGKIDRIITKSVSRFARNTAEFLAATRALKKMGVSIYFEEQGIDTETVDLELMMTFPGIAAQRESETISENMRWSYQKRMESGDFNCCRAAYGYDLIDGELRINEAEAQVVRRIFHLYLQGCGKQAIANQLNAEGVPKRYGQKTWHLFTINYILNHYTERIHREPGWKLVGIYADKGITGTSMKKRDEFNKLIRQCKRGRVDMIIVKSISRFARNTLDCIKITRMLREIKVDVYFEEQNLHSIDPASEFYISIYGSIAQSESENISHNVAWGKAQSAKEGNVSFAYKSFLGYRQGADGKPEIDPAQAITVRRIYTEFLSGNSLQQIADGLTADSIPTPMGKAVWQPGVIQSILSNVKYKGDALLGKTYVKDCISKKVRINGGERPQYYVENNHPAIIDADTFAQVQEELARRASKRKVKQIGTTTEQGKYCGKYALTELLICGECGTPYRRCTWTAGGQKRIVWRCINRLDYGKKYCHHSPTIEESPLQKAIMNAILKTAKSNPDILQTLKMHIQIALGAEAGEDESVDIQIRIAQIDKEFNDILNTVTAENPESLLTDPRIEAMMSEKRMLENRLAEYIAAEQHRKSTKSRLEQIFTILDGMKNHPLTFDNEIIRKILQCVIVESKDKIKVVFIGGLEMESEVEQ